MQCRCSLILNVSGRGAEGSWYETDRLLAKSIRFETKYIAFGEVLFRFTRTCTTYITFFDVKFEHSNLQGPFCELLSHTTSLYLMIFVTGSYKK